jgi:hypothetical protein
LDTPLVIMCMPAFGLLYVAPSFPDLTHPKLTPYICADAFAFAPPASLRHSVALTSASFSVSVITNCVSFILPMRGIQ